jgi:hypothetical protein
VACKPFCDIGMQAGGHRIAMTDCEQSVGDGVTASCVTALVTAAPDPRRRAPQRQKQAPDRHRHDDGDAEHKREHADGGL